MFPNIHDSKLVGYSVDSNKETLCLHVEPQSWQSFSPFMVVFSGVKSHQFAAPHLPAILGNIVPQMAVELVRTEWSCIAAGFTDCGWPGAWAQNLDSALQFVSFEQLTGYRIESSYGLSGWVLAKEAKTNGISRGA